MHLYLLQSGATYPEDLKPCLDKASQWHLQVQGRCLPSHFTKLCMDPILRDGTHATCKCLCKVMCPVSSNRDAGCYFWDPTSSSPEVWFRDVSLWLPKTLICTPGYFMFLLNPTVHLMTFTFNFSFTDWSGRPTVGSISTGPSLFLCIPDIPCKPLGHPML